MSFWSHRSQVVTGGFLVQLMVIGSMFAYGVFFVALEQEFGWSRTFLSACTSLAFFVMGTGAILAGRLNDRFGPRGVLTFSGLVFGVGYALLSQMSEPWHLLVLFGLFVGIGLSTHDVVTLSTIAGWFPDRRGTMSGIVKSGTAVGQVLIPLSASFLIVWTGWRSAFLIIGLIAIVVLLSAAACMRAAPAAQASAGGVHGKLGLSFDEIRRSRQFWTFCAIQFAFFPSLMTVPVHIVVHGIDLGLTPGTAAGVLSALGGVSVIGRLVLGSAVDRMGGRRSLLICFLMLCASLFLLRFADTVWLLYGFAVLYGLAHGGFFTVVSPALAEYFGLRAHGVTFGFVLFSGTIGGALGPIIAGSIFDTTGSYLLAFNVLTGLALTGLMLVLSLTPVRAAGAMQAAAGS